ncbi:MAG: hypothetical protein GY953_07705 [bacterium]|nr:hypothetical protein [bacterium]
MFLDGRPGEFRLCRLPDQADYMAEWKGVGTYHHHTNVPEPDFSPALAVWISSE